MANPNPSKNTRFKPGNRANPLGAAAHNQAAKMVDRLTNAECVEILNVIIRGTRNDLIKITKDPKSEIVRFIEEDESGKKVILKSVAAFKNSVAPSVTVPLTSL